MPAPQLLVIDEVGYLSYSNRHADLMFELVSRRYQTRSTLITTNRPFAEWREVFPNAACVVSLIDRLVHNAEIIAIEGESYRLKEARRAHRTARPPAPRQKIMSTRLKLPAAAVLIPDWWTPEQVLAVFELLCEPRDRVCAIHGCRIQDLPHPGSAATRAGLCRRWVASQRTEPRRHVVLIRVVTAGVHKPSGASRHPRSEIDVTVPQDRAVTPTAMPPGNACRRLRALLHRR